MHRLTLFVVALAAPAADLPIRQVTLYKHGVAHFARAGTLEAGQTVQFDFKASDMNDVLKSLTIVDASGTPVAGVRYEASEPLERRLQNFPFAIPGQASLAAFLDQMKGARIELRLGPDTVAGSILSARLAQANDGARAAEQQILVLLTDAGEIRSFDLSAASAVRLTDPKLQELLRDYLAAVSGARSRDRRRVYVDSGPGGPRQISASYLTPAAVWKSTYRLLFGPQGEPTLEGWAIVDNTSGEDWTNVRLSVVSGRPASFIMQLYEPRYVDRPRAELAEDQPVAPQVFEGALRRAVVPQALAFLAAEERPESALADQAKAAAVPSTVTAAAGRELAELFEYSFGNSVTIKQGESAMLPFLQQRIEARKLVIYSESFGLHPRNAAEISNTTGKTLDGGPITVYDANAYAGEALVETLKAGDKRLISYGVDLGTRISTKFDSSSANVREIHFRRGVLITRSAIQEIKTYTIANLDPGRKTLMIQHPKRAGYELLGNLQPTETTSDAYRFEVAVAGNAEQTFAVREERLFSQSYEAANLTPDLLTSFVQNRALSAAGRMALEAILAKKREIAANAAQLEQTRAELRNLSEDEARIRNNIASLRQVAGQESQLQQYARQLAEAETRITGLRDRESQLNRAQGALEAELNALIESADF